MSDATLLWFRLDLRLTDNPALLAALHRGGPVLPVFIWAPEEEGRWQPGAASRWWLHQSLTKLDAALRERGSRLIVRRGPTLQALRELAQQSGARAVYWNRRYEPAVIERDRHVKNALHRYAITAESYNAAVDRAHAAGASLSSLLGVLENLSFALRAGRNRGGPPRDKAPATLARLFAADRPRPGADH
jgi:deoxyribodipyrimidine photolyase